MKSIFFLLFSFTVFSSEVFKLPTVQENFKNYHLLAENSNDIYNAQNFCVSEGYNYFIEYKSDKVGNIDSLQLLGKVCGVRINSSGSIEDYIASSVYNSDCWRVKIFTSITCK